MDEQARAALRQARLDAGLSLRELGRRTGVSASMLSQIEQGKSDPSVSTLYALVSALELSLDALLSHTVGAPHGGIGTAVRRSPVVAANERALLQVAGGVRWERLTTDEDPAVESLLVTYEPGSASSSDGGLMAHSGMEYAYLISGHLTLQLGFDTFAVKAGESVHFDAARPHLYRNDATVPAVGVWFVVGRFPSDTTLPYTAARSEMAPYRDKVHVQ